MAEHFTANSQVFENTKLDRMPQALMLGLSVKIMVI